MSLLNQDYSTTSSTSPQVAQAMQTLARAQEKVSETAATGTNQASVSITIDARRAAAEKADAGKSAVALADELRASFDKQYAAASKRDSADLSAMSGRALATITLNETGQFRKVEIAAAKLELRSRDRQSALTMLASGPLTSASLATYTRGLLAARDEMSAEEQRLRVIDPDLR
jgi:hypothetical protein